MSKRQAPFQRFTVMWANCAQPQTGVMEWAWKRFNAQPMKEKLKRNEIFALRFNSIRTTEDFFID